jgi:hypothetical protein
MTLGVIRSLNDDCWHTNILSETSRSNTLHASFSYPLLVPAHQRVRERGGSIVYLSEISDSQIFVLPGS